MAETTGEEEIYPQAAGTVPSLGDFESWAGTGEDDLKVVCDVALRCAQQCAEALDVIYAVRWYAKTYGDIPASLSNQPSGEDVRNKINEGGRAFDQSLAEFGEILRALGEAFAELGRAHVEAEEESARELGVTVADFDAISFPSSELESTTLQSLYHVNPAVETGDESRFPFSEETPYLTAPSARTSGYTGATPAFVPWNGDNFESPIDMSYSDLYEFREDILTRNTPEMCFDTSGRWLAMGHAISDVCDELITNLENMTQDNWIGPARVSAFETIKESVLPDIRKGSSAAFAHGDLIAFVGTSLDLTAQAIPDDPEPPKVWWKTPSTWAPNWSWTAGAAAEIWAIDEGKVDEYRQKVEENYTAKLTAAIGLIPTMPSVETVLGGDTPSAENPYTPTPTNTNTTPLPDLTGAGGDLGGGDLNPSTTAPTSDDWAAQQEEWAAQQEELRQAQEDAAEQQAMQSAATQGLSAAQGIGEQLLNAAKDLAGNAMQTPSMVPTSLPGLDPTAASAYKPNSFGGGGGMSAGASSTATPKGAFDGSKLFPRAGIPVSTTLTSGTGGVSAASTAGTPGSPGAAGSPGGARGGQNENKHERAKYLDRADNLDDGLGDAPEMTRPVVGETGRPEPGQPPVASVTATAERREAPVAPPTAPTPAPPRQAPRQRVSQA